MSEQDKVIQSIQSIGHCCACTGVCHHVGGPFYCPAHFGQPAVPFNPVPFVPAQPAMPFSPMQPIVPQGWQCPVCKAVYSPSTGQCYNCRGISTITVVGGSGVAPLTVGVTHSTGMSEGHPDPNVKSYNS